MDLLNIYKASAGSGKTHRLSLEFLKYVIQDPTSFERILAVTFTNKATAEMKTRIISNLYGIAKNLSESQRDISDLIRELSPLDAKYSSSSYIISQAQKALSMMLHNYSHFHIETIDSFFQTVLRTLEKELGLGTHLNIELDNESVLAEAADSLLDDIPNNPTLRVWVQQYLNSKLDADKSWNITGEIADFGKILFSEGFQAESDRLFAYLEQKDALSHYKQCLKKHSENCLNDLVESAKRFMKFNIDPDLCYRKKQGVCGYFSKIIERGDFWSEMNSYVREFYEQKEESKLSKSPQVLAHLNEIHQILDETEKLRQYCCMEITTVELITDNLFQVGLLHYLDKKLRSINAENNQFMLSDTQVLLSKMIQDNDAPFIYEKIGAYLDHVMIDEFQDTSETQWRNFKPLIVECSSRENSNLVVGDPKQSIYRFRNGKWELLGRLKDEMSHFHPKEISLDTNWRSEKNIVNFNNKVFSYLPELYKTFGVVDSNDSLLNSMVTAYEDATQLCNKRENNKGYVKVQLFEASDREVYEENTLKALADGVKQMQMRNIKPEQMVILIRTNKYVPMIAEYFSWYKAQEGNGDYCYDLISEEAYQLDASDTIQAIVSALRYIVTLSANNRNEKEKKQKNLLAIAQLLHSYQKVQRNGERNIIPPDPNHLDDSQQKFIDSIANLKLLPLYEMVEEIYRIMDLKRIPNQENYYCFFLDRVNDFLVKYSSNLRLFLRYWDDHIHSMTIPSGESRGIRVMTIHKSKGLEFHTVFMPFCDWHIGIDSNITNILWESTAKLPELYSELPFTAVKCTSKMIPSHFQPAYMKELVETYMDNLNVLYVALTRAEKNLVIFGKKAGKRDKNGNLVKEDQMEVISHLLQNMFQRDRFSFLEEDKRRPLWDEMATIEQFSKADEELCYELGTLESEVDEEEVKHTENPFKLLPEKESFQITTYSQKGKFRQSKKSDDFIDDIEVDESSFIEKGKLLHGIFSQIKSYDDIEDALKRAEFEGLIQSGEIDKYLSSFQEVMATDEGKKWFRPGLTLYNECTILSRQEDGKVREHRPDRVIRDGNHMTVIDFKFGKKSQKYQEQIDLYVDLLTQMGYEAEGHIWYLKEYFA